MNLAKPELLKHTGELLLGVIGNPIAHSKSPVMHKAALAALGIPGAYVPMRVAREQVGTALEGIKALGFRGINVTIPHKLEVIPFLNELDETALKIGAVNTIVNDGGHLTGYNTDGIGYVRSLKEEAIAELKGKNILVLGAGGASRGIVYALTLEHPDRIYVANRTADKAQALAAEWKELADIRGMAMDGVPGMLSEVDVIINTTSVGMHPHMDGTPLDPDRIPPGIVVSDLIYNPLKTRLLADCEKKGCVIHGGLGMFVNQGAFALEYWTGLPAPVEAMRSAVLASMKET
ncbi:shikimate dehydrogenase [Paenibacillus rhizosphaerae]|uniref:Shikimate dehydrogenase (NADP(+)) n=1 Tax=Paenibacillus rhizosphaerae TaxID=297318 RepID=A0A839TNE0_9BACL|nr:shikimate dehydrogenase [Paenibacillus rhizosphaerae]MBB3127230.1 shikimate dehydrogenase [Paenibacillus rhizosphaerae]